MSESKPGLFLMKFNVPTNIAYPKKHPCFPKQAWPISRTHSGFRISSRSIKCNLSSSSFKRSSSNTLTENKWNSLFRYLSNGGHGDILEHIGYSFGMPWKRETKLPHRHRQEEHRWFPCLLSSLPGSFGNEEDGFPLPFHRHGNRKRSPPSFRRAQFQAASPSSEKSPDHLRKPSKKHSTCPNCLHLPRALAVTSKHSSKG